MSYPSLIQFETRRAELEAQLSRLVELRAHLRAVEAARSSSNAEGGSRHASGPAQLRPSEIT